MRLKPKHTWNRLLNKSWIGAIVNNVDFMIEQPLLCNIIWLNNQGFPYGWQA